MDDVEHEATVIKVATVIALGVILLAAVIGITFVSVLTDRDMARSEAFTFGGCVLLAGLGGLSWWALRRRHRWHVHVDRDEEQPSE